MKLVVFDVDGTLVDSQHHIFDAMTAAFSGAGLQPLPKQQVLQIVGLSLPVAVEVLAPDQMPETHRRILDGYRQAYLAARMADAAPLYPGARECLDRLASHDDLLLAVATGKARRGLDAMIEIHGLQGRFVSLQTADNNPSKPHPAMLEAALSDAGVDARDAVMVGDTSFDMQMAQSARVAGFGVSWGYHAPELLEQAGATLIAPDFPALTKEIEEWATT
ncbi:HAD-IA family hydrolase [Paracoccus sp. 11-3]|uniref:HAD-IA family hydrolase n=1 Tax=Paracoccus amoyensis TaxID=2760093 RepID=A0A926GQH5_9RHOB|nr:HAD-IA family hydrolase [Paracoccus amoyensis]MBC9248090.1 HAD-IA family hydrolase [Paracoccus amoyensis]